MDDLPHELAARILKYLSFDEISRYRIVSKTFDFHCRRCLNFGFHKVDRYHTFLSQRVKAQLPRRESERRIHELSRHSDILGAVETRLSLLTMTFNKYIDSDICCFIPGKVLDELFRLLRLVERSIREVLDNNKKSEIELARPHELLQELRDISSMAMEYFDEILVHDFRDIFTSRLNVVNFSIMPIDTLKVTQVENQLYSIENLSENYGTPCKSKQHETSLVTPTNFKTNLSASTSSADRLMNLQQKLKEQKLETKSCKQQIKQLHHRLEGHSKKLAEHNRLIRKQSSLIVDMNKRLLELNTELTNFKRQYGSEDRHNLLPGNSSRKRTFTATHETCLELPSSASTIKKVKINGDGLFTAT